VERKNEPPTTIKESQKKKGEKRAKGKKVAKGTVGG